MPMKKETFYLVCFESSQRAVWLHKEAAKRTGGIRLVPIPPEIRAGCGLGLKMSAAIFEELMGAMSEEIEKDDIYLVHKEDGHRSVLKWEEKSSI
jgi:hypothetical protein